MLHLNTPYLYPIIDAYERKGKNLSYGSKIIINRSHTLDIELTMVSPIPKLRIPAKGASGRSFSPDDIHLGSAQPSKSEKWLKTPIIFGLSYHRT